MPKRILIELLVVRFVAGIVTRMVAVQRLLGNGLRAPVLIIGLAPFGIGLVVPVGFALSSYISTAAAPRTTYPSSSSRLPASSWSASASPACPGPTATATLGVAGPASRSSGWRDSAHVASEAAPPPAWGLVVVIAVVRVFVATTVVVVVVAVVVVVILVAVVLGGVGVRRPPTGTSAPASGGGRHGGRGRVVVIIVPEGGRKQERR